MKPSVDGAVAMARGIAGFDVEETSNTKLARILVSGLPMLAIQKDVDTLNIWLPTSLARKITCSAAKVERRFGTTASGQSAAKAQPGMHSGLKPFFGTNELTCFKPKTLDEAWEILGFVA